MDLGQCFKQPLALPLLSTFHTFSLTSFDVAQNGEIQNTWADYLQDFIQQDGRMEDQYPKINCMSINLQQTIVK